MRLADFILSDMEPILAEWEAFAGTLTPAADGLGSLALRDHAQQILEAVAADLRMAQDAQQQADKSRGLAPPLLGAADTAAQIHAVLRARSGFDIRQLVAEYRALRASVLRLWGLRSPDAHTADFDDVIRFDEAIDQALSESVEFFSRQVEQSRNLMLGMLGHDMRSPLQAIQMTASYLAKLNAGEAVSDAAGRLIRSGARMKGLLDDLLDFNRLQLGLGIRIEPAPADFARLADEVVSELRAAYPRRRIELDAATPLPGAWDADRVHQMLGNLVVNALTHGAADAPVTVRLEAEANGVRADIGNRGPSIDAAELATLFEPLRRGPPNAGDGTQEEGLGLGLYIASEVARRHGGRIEARSDDTGTVFTVWLPLHVA